MTISKPVHEFVRVENGWPACRCGYEPSGVPKLDACDLVGKHILSYQSAVMPSPDKSPLQRLTDASAAFLAAGRELEAARVEFAQAMGAVTA